MVTALDLSKRFDISADIFCTAAAGGKLDVFAAAVNDGLFVRNQTQVETAEGKGVKLF